ncbi:cholesterol 24-hydroxylase-like isoform X2 [Stylophora pistillata]|uniref:cholesterol 24-hydroxylase-like isoform X2 n=1 Tax=Stylophora pistillata TaxID=50429 RepID=UPI000C0577F7|nr:cholesterol 24-hydroxylase-like isoform X2 [Stylophora pistillata]
MLYLLFYLFGALLSLSLVLVSSFATYLVYKRNKFLHIPSPPMSSFFKGHADQISAMRHTGYPTDQKFLEWHIEYGRTLVVWFWHIPVLLVVDPELIKDVLVVKCQPKDAMSYEILGSLFGQRFLGCGLVTNLDHGSWKKRRAIMHPAFHRKSLKDLMGSFNSSADLLLEHLCTMADGQTEIQMFNQFTKAALDVICKFNVFQYPFQRKVVKAVQFLRETGRKVIEVRKHAMARGEEVPDDILQRIIQQQEEIPELGIEDLVDDFVTFFIAGHETTSSLLAFCVLDLGDHPDILDSLVGEVFDVLGEKQHVSFDDLAKLHQLGLVIKETLRRHPPATGNIRKIEKDQDVGRYKIPADVAVITSTYVVSHFPEYWKNPEEFNPYRFDDDEVLRRCHYSYFPFSLGPRNCIGLNFAQIEAKVLLSRFLQTFKFSLVPGQSRDVLERGTLRPKDGVRCTLTRRH